MVGGALRVGALALVAAGSWACDEPAEVRGPEAPLQQVAASADGNAGSSAGLAANMAGAPGISSEGGGSDAVSSDTSGSDTPAEAEMPSAGGTAPASPSASGGAAGSAPVAEAAGSPGASVFAAGQVLDVRLTLLAADLVELEEHGDREEYVPAAVQLAIAGKAPVSLAEVGVRHKGNWTLHHCWDDFGGARSYDGDCVKLSLKLDFDEYAESQRFDGLKRLNLHAAAGDASKLRELVAYGMFRAFGVDAPRAIPARVYVNDEPWGVFIAVEDVDGRYTKAHYPDGPDGNLYKEVWPNAAFEDGDFSLALETNRELADVSDMRAFAQAVARSGSEALSPELEAALDLDALTRYLAVDRAIRNWDGITSFYDPRTPHNFYWYHDDGPAPRFHLIPWDLDDSYWPYDPYTHPEPPVSAAPIPDLNVRPAHCEPRPIWRADGSAGYVTPGRCDTLLDVLVRSHWVTVADRGRELLAGPFEPARQRAVIDTWAASVAPIVAEDPTLDPLAWEGAVAELGSIVERAAATFESLLDEGLRSEQLESGATDD